MPQTPFLFPQWRWPDFRLNLTQIVTQIRSLLDVGLLTVATVGLWFVWADVTPALNILDRVPLWQTTVEEVVETKGTDDKAVVQVVTRPKAVTAANLGLALLMMAIAVVAGRNIPGLVEVILLEHLSVDAGFRFATTCLVRYAIFIVGVIFAFAQIGIGWNSVQWLVAAASVGLGFGLQEIFANFVSGIILLFERPMRVGDVITIGDTTGTVSRIRFRATTIIDGDRKELIVPNKSFITGNLLNWTLSDSVNRLAIKICVGPDNDPQQVRDTIYSVPPGVTGIGSIVFRDEEHLLSQPGIDAAAFYEDEIAPYKGALETWYIAHRSLLLDARLVFLTVWVVFRPASTIVFRTFNDLPARPSWLIA